MTSVPNDKGSLQFAIVSKDGINLMFQEKENFIGEYPSLKTERVYPSISLYTKICEFNKFYAQIEEIYEILVPMHETFYGSKEFAIADNNGYILTFTEER